MKNQFTIVIVAAVLMVFRANAQEPQSTLVGVVRDIGGSVVPNVHIEVIGETNGMTRTVNTNPAGEYAIIAIPSGSYSLAATHADFREVRVKLALQVDQTRRFDFVMEVGNREDVVEVRTEPLPLETETVARGQVVDQVRLTSLPLNAREFLQLSLTAPGTTPPAEGSNLSTARYGALNINGARETDNRFTIDGIENMDLLNGQTALSPSIDTIQEFKLVTSSYRAEFGGAGGFVTAITRSGGDTVHGRAFEFGRNAALDAKNYFDDPNRPIPPFHRNQFGAVVGGPLGRGTETRSFFFGGYEGLRMRRTVVALARVPAAAEKMGAFSGGQIDKTRIDPLAKRIAALYPDPNQSGVNNYLSSANAWENSDQVTGRIDRQIARNTNGFFRFIWSDSEQLDPFSRSETTLPGFGIRWFTGSRNAALGVTTVFHSGLENEFRLGMSRIHDGLFGQNYPCGVSSSLVIPGTKHSESSDPRLCGSPFVIVAGYTNVGDSIGNPQDRHDTTYHLQELLVFQNLHHLTRTGYQYQRAQVNAYFGFLARGEVIFTGQFSGNSIGDLLLGLPALSVRALGDESLHERANFHAGFIEDTWRISNRVTLTSGVRYEYQQPSVDPHDQKSNFLPKAGQVILVNKGPLQGNRAGYRADYNNFAPRVGLAWTPVGRVSARAAYGMYYATNYLAIPALQTRFTTPFVQVGVYAAAPGTPLTLENAFPSQQSLNSTSPRGISYDFRSAYVQHWNVTIQAHPADSTLLDIAYVGSGGRKLPQTVNINQPYPASMPMGLRRPHPAYGDIAFTTSDANSSYNGLQSGIQLRIGQKSDLLGSYTWSKSIDLASSGIAQTLETQDAYHLNRERGLSDFDRRHRLVLSYVYEPFRGWSVSGIWTFSTGQPFTPILSQDVSGTGSFRDRPDRIGDGNLRSEARHPDHWSDSSAFVSPPPGHFGNSGRNILTGPGTANIDVAVSKTATFKERTSVQLRIESFNLLNHPQFFLPNRLADIPVFGTITRAKSGRELQIAVKVSH